MKTHNIDALVRHHGLLSSEVLILAIVGMLGPSLENVVLACIVAKFPWYTRMVRTIVRKYTGMNYILYAKVREDNY